MNKKIVIVATLLVGLIVSTCSEGQKYVLGKEIEIQYYDTLSPNDWISFDGVKWGHTDRYVLSIEDSSLYDQNKNLFMLPSSLQNIKVEGADDHMFKSNYNNSSVAYELFYKLSMMKSGDGGPKYKMKGYILELANGKFQISRFDGEPIKVMTSKGYGAQVKKIN